jgi:hypothetical protein
MAIKRISFTQSLTQRNEGNDPGCGPLCCYREKKAAAGNLNQMLGGFLQRMLSENQFLLFYSFKKSIAAHYRCQKTQNSSLAKLFSPGDETS